MNPSDNPEKLQLPDEKEHDRVLPPETPGEPEEGRQPETTAPETMAPEAEAAQPAEAEAPRRRSWIKRLGTFLFNPETRLGSTVRAALRWAALVVAVFALGVLTAYVLLYQPAQIDLNATRQSLEAAETLLEENRSALDASARRVDNLQDENQALQSNLEAAVRRGYLLKMLHHVHTARIALEDENSSAAAAALGEARRELEHFLPWLEAEDAEYAKAFSLRLELASNGLTRDPAIALADLDILINSLLLLEKTILSP